MQLVKGGTAERPALMVRRCRQLTNVTSRVWWFDRQLLAALSTAAAAGQCNVVLLGSGMDTRPWRLALPPGEALVAAVKCPGYGQRPTEGGLQAAARNTIHGLFFSDAQ